MTHAFDFDPPKFANETELTRLEQGGQLAFADPLQPKPGSVKASVLNLLMAFPDGMCRRDFAQEDIFEVSNRIGELEADGWIIHKSRCGKHPHRQRFTLYSI